jgi:hypothetical protein
MHCCLFFSPAVARLINFSLLFPFALGAFARFVGFYFVTQRAGVNACAASFICECALKQHSILIFFHCCFFIISDCW